LTQLAPRKFSPTVAKYDHIAGSYVRVVCPYGNVFIIHQHDTKIGFKGGFGLAYVEFTCPQKSAQDIANYYSDYLGAISSVHKGEPFGYVRFYWRFYRNCVCSLRMRSHPQATQLR
jgi:hypothetical protein